jgi:hypothetical protein
MRILATMVVFESIIGDEEVMRVRKRFGDAWMKLQESGRVVASGIFADARGGFVVVDVDSAGEFWKMLGPGILDSLKVRTHPVMETQEFMSMFSDLMAGNSTL